MGVVGCARRERGRRRRRRGDDEQLSHDRRVSKQAAGGIKAAERPGRMQATVKEATKGLARGEAAAIGGCVGSW
eukprot:CAMPEP_0172580000 /NCGR_PEP_ID=MMETSP1067-20121228/139536_1 /TAXON_ID=265564 ORGANISM="Thalassiosira punctigera, Strain Tpunct2005C2" /NCGR_SAMPLE_ID=MMETSP1067 /ASSEMBLY_ACC=CAM_ASM_000444 /LENGTH=73 /DNA_ID=CAMNT_0013372731 /DNA_START=566 /DNA_END=784 /DNA_ORIENTATION=+